MVGETVVFGHYAQEGGHFNEDWKVIDAVRDIADWIPLKGGAKLTAAQLLERFLFPHAMHHQFIRLLSGGERKRLHLLRILMRNPNFLVLDEPTNDLDIFTLSVLEEFLMDFSGCLVVVSHDRYFMDKLVDHVWVLGEDGQTSVRDYPGNYSQYRAMRSEEAKRAHASQAASKRDTPAPEVVEIKRGLLRAPELQGAPRIRNARKKTCPYSNLGEMNCRPPSWQNQTTRRCNRLAKNWANCQNRLTPQKCVGWNSLSAPDPSLLTSTRWRC